MNQRMTEMLDSPYVVFTVSLFVLWLSAQVGDLFRKKVFRLKGDERADLGDVLAATLTLLALIIGFSFSMAVSRYDQRKNFEEAEANAPEQAAKYKELQQKLAELNERRKLARERLEGCKNFRDKMDAFVQVEGGLQANLVTKNGEMEEELEKMRMLMLRVARGVDLLDDTGGEDEKMDVDWEKEQDGKVMRILS